MATTPTYVGTPKVGLAQILPADTTANKTIVTAGASGSKITGLTLTSNDSAAKVVQVSLVRTAVTYILGSVAVPALSGTDGVAAGINVLTNTLIPGIPVDNDGQAYIYLQSGDTLVAAVTVTLTAAKTISLTATFGDF